MKHFRAFKARGEKKKEEVIREAVDFLKRQLQYDEETGQSQFAVIGLSGGIDSAVVLALAAQAVGSENIIAVKMPRIGITSEESGEYADLLARTFRIKHAYEIPINRMVDAQDQEFRRSGVELGAFELGNASARARANILYAFANKYGGRVIDTCNRTEIMMGYFTKYGDGASDMNPVGEIYKTWMWLIAAPLRIPERIIKRKPSAELVGFSQSDEKDMGISYSALDLLLYLKNMGYSDDRLVEEISFPRTVVERTSATIEKNRHKRILVPVCPIDI
jgi:NAD+ synthase